MPRIGSGVGAGVLYAMSAAVINQGGYALTPINNYVGFVGDSLTTAGGDMTGTYRFWNTSGSVASYGAWAMCLPAEGFPGSEGHPIWAGNSALSGVPVSTIRSTYWPAMRDATPKRGIVVIMACSNDIGAVSPGGVVSSVALAAREADMRFIYEDALANGQLPVACTIPPSGTVNSRPGVLAINEMIRLLAAEYNIPLADTFVPVGDIATGNWLDSNYQSGDGIHYATAGARLSGQVLRNTLQEILIEEDESMFPTEADPTMGGRNEWLGSMFDADVNANGRPDGGFQSLVTDAWGAASNGATLSIVDGGVNAEGKWLQMAKSSSATASSASTTPSTGGGPLIVTSGDRFVVGFRFELDDPTTTLVGMSLTIVQATDGAHTLFLFSTLGQLVDMTGLRVRLLTKPAASSQTNMRLSYQTVISSTGGLATARMAELSVVGPVAA